MELNAVVGLSVSRGGAVGGRNKLTAIHASIVGGDCTFQTPFGPKRLLYADWAASGRAVAPLEDFLRSEVSKASEASDRKYVTACCMCDTTRTTVCSPLWRPTGAEEARRGFAPSCGVKHMVGAPADSKCGVIRGVTERRCFRYTATRTPPRP